MIDCGVPRSIQHIIRMFNTNIDGTQLITIALTKIRGIGLRFADIVCKRAGIDISKRAGELTEEEMESIQNVIMNPLKYGIPAYMLNRQNDRSDGSTSQLVSNNLDASLRLYIEKGKKLRVVRVLRLARGLKCRGQRTKSNGRHGSTLGVSRKK